MAYVKGNSGSCTFGDYYFQWKLNWSQEYDIATNTSIVSIDSLQVWSDVQGGGAWHPNLFIQVNGQNVIEMNYYAPATHRVYAYADSVWRDITTNYDNGLGAPWKSEPIVHNVDGTKSINISVIANPAGHNITSIQLYRSADGLIRTYKSPQSFNVELGKIPRKAELKTAPDFTDLDESVTITYNNPGGTAVTALDACISFTGAHDDIVYRPVNKTGTSYTFTFTEAERESLLRATSIGYDSRTVKFFLRTKIGNETYYSTLDRTFTVVEAEPELQIFFTDTNSKAIELTGDSLTTIIKGYSDLAYEMTATPKKYASIVSYTAVNGSKTLTTASGVFEKVQSADLTLSATDSRKLKTTKGPYNLNMIQYFEPTIEAEGTIEMDGETTARVSIKISGTFFNGSFGYQDNEIDILVKHSAADDWVSFTNDLYFDIPTDGNKFSTNEFGISGLDYTKAFVFQVKVVDKLSQATTSEQTLKLIPVFDWSENDFNFNVPVSFQGTTLLDLLHPIGSVYISRSAVHPSTIFGGVWREIKDKFILAAGDTYASGSTGGEASHTLTVNEMPSHSHSLNTQFNSTGGETWKVMLSSTTGGQYTQAAGSTINNTGGGAAHNNMPPYLALYMWERIRG